MLTADANMDVSSVDTLNIYPPLVADATGSVTYDNVPIKVFQDTDTIKFLTQANGAFKYEIVLNEEI